MTDKIDKLQEKMEEHQKESRTSWDEIKDMLKDGAVKMENHRVRIENNEDKIKDNGSKILWLFRTIFGGLFTAAIGLVVWLIQGGGKS